MTVLAAYSFDEGSGTTAADAVGTRDITVVSPGNWSASGHTNSAFNGAGGIRNVPSIVGLETASRTLMFWARIPGTLGSQWGVQFYLIAPDTAAWGIGWIGGNLFMRARVGGVNTNLTTPVVDQANWHHFALTYDGATLRGYRDAVQFSSAPLSGTIDSANQINLSDTPDTSLLDDLRFFDEALDQATIASLMNTPVLDAVFGASTIQSSFALTASAASAGEADLNFTFAMTASGTVPGNIVFCEPLIVTPDGPVLTVQTVAPYLTAEAVGPELTVEVTPC